MGGTPADVISEVRGAYRAGLVRLGLSSDVVGALTGGLSVAAAALSTMGASRAAIVHNMEALRPRIDRWATVYRTWAENGKRDDGTPYGWAKWSEFAGDLASEIKAQTNYAVDASALRVISQAVAQTATDVQHAAETIANPFTWPLWVKAAVGLGLAGGIALFIRRL